MMLSALFSANLHIVLQCLLMMLSALFSVNLDIVL